MLQEARLKLRLRGVRHGRAHRHHGRVPRGTGIMVGYVGGSGECIQAVLEHPDLEALPTSLDARLDVGGDTVNG